MNFHDLLNMLGTLQKTLLQDIWREGIYPEGQKAPCFSWGMNGVSCLV